ncbi:MAG: RecX family transcriptional regulator [Bacteroidetes bacterium]|nr:RecX family transcriptional regulator [Bacteroidota bacterium]MDA1332823.1 RecX family transcriptional regulator [Bacteroidota bacterium]
MRPIKAIELPAIPESGGMITEISVQVKDANRCSVYLDGAFAFGLHMNVVADAGLKKGIELSYEDCQKHLEDDLYYKAFKRCLDYISYRPRSRFEIKRRLKDLGVPEPIAKRIEERLDSLGYLNDESFAELWASSRFRSKGYGPARLLAELRTKGIDADVARQAVEAVCPPDKMEEQLAALVVKAQHRYRTENDSAKKKQKIIAFLARRGFSISDILAALN